MTTVIVTGTAPIMITKQYFKRLRFRMLLVGALGSGTGS